MHKLKFHFHLKYIILIGFAQLSISSAYAVVGGRPTSLEMHASIVNVVFERTVCSGTLVAPNVVMTADHCANKYGKPLVVAHINSKDITKDCDKQAVVDSAFDPSSVETPFNIHSPDIHLLKLEAPLCSAQPATLATVRPQPTDSIFLAGHGPSDYDYGVTTQAEAQVLYTLETRHHVSAPDGHPDWKFLQLFLLKGMVHYMSAVPVEDGSTICPGDSGGPVFKDAGGTMEVYGVNGLTLGNDKLGSTKCNYGYVQIFTPVAPHLEWIQGQIDDWQEPNIEALPVAHR